MFSAKCKIERNTKKKKQTLFVNTLVLIVLVKMSVFFSAFFMFVVFGISMFFRDAFDRFPKIKKTKYESNKNKKTTTTRKQDAKQKQI